MSITGKMNEILDVKFDAFLRKLNGIKDGIEEVPVVSKGTQIPFTGDLMVRMSNILKGFERVAKKFGIEDIQNRVAAVSTDEIGEKHTSIEGTAATIYGFRKVSDKILNSSFTLPDLPAFNEQPVGGAANTVWDTNNCGLIAGHYNRLRDVLKELKVTLLPNLKF